MKPIPSDTHLTVLSMLWDGHSSCHIASKLHIGHSTVSEIHSKALLPLPTNAGGCPSKLTPHDWRHLASLITSGQADTATQLKEVTWLAVSAQTIRNHLKKENMKAVVKASASALAYLTALCICTEVPTLD
ncbi:hypothetical protein BKA82DRAFT_138431 [Pisolithus tinctorius]|uniref:Uncharacterized protein n=1 Tax=Pisolithus tinctorius Marx 270 TaxID=870435 RepID=A0A0C3KAI5_PISTI|nr:hypothetical protein BKA82DRAFT_138431 [Pisolithus tinctorius]KIO06642.1 hypothetical protein M404DRAFT_138431 [Pisolithus tinctorius Marx 270]